jgi:hypothetical protein
VWLCSGIIAVGTLRDCGFGFSGLFDVGYGVAFSRSAAEDTHRARRGASPPDLRRAALIQGSFDTFDSVDLGVLFASSIYPV